MDRDDAFHVSYRFDQFLAGLVVLRASGKRHDTIVHGDGERLRVDEDTFRDGLLGRWRASRSPARCGRKRMGSPPSRGLLLPTAAGRLSGHPGCDYPQFLSAVRSLVENSVPPS